jgi:hypothetical protein
VKCKSKRDMKNEKQVTMKNGRMAVSGNCSVCGTKMFRIGGGGSSSSSSSGGRSTARLAVAKQRPKVKAASKKSSSKAKKAGKSKTRGKKK